MFILDSFRLYFAYQWLLASLAATAAWILVMASKTAEAQTIPLLRWQPESLFSTSPEFLIDSISWFFSITLVTLCLAVLLTAVVRRPLVDWRSWAGTLILTGYGLFAVLAGNPLTLMLSWAAIDLFETWIIFSWIRRSEVRMRFLLALSTRLLGMALLVYADIIARAEGSVLTFTAIPSSASVILLIASGLRLGVLPLQPPFLQDHPLRRSLGTPLRMIPAAASLVLLVRAAGAQISPGIAPFLLILAGLSGIYSALSWVTANSELSGRPYWILGMASLAVASAVRMQPEACLMWGVACLLSGGAIFVYSIRPRGLAVFFLLGALGLTAFPFTPTWSGAAVYRFTSVFVVPFFDIAVNIVFLLTHLGLVFGFIRHAMRTVEVPTGLERWVWFFYPLGLALLIFLEYYLGWQVWIEWTKAPGDLWWAGGLVLVMAGAAWLLLYRTGRFTRLIQYSKEIATTGTTVWNKVLSLEWFYRLVWVVYHLFSRVITWLTTILEGDGGILWALVFLFLLISLTFTGGISR